jgi:hypothetical protein
MLDIYCSPAMGEQHVSRIPSTPPLEHLLLLAATPSLLDVWKNLEITGSNEKNGKADTFSLNIWFEDVKIPRLEALAQK